MNTFDATDYEYALRFSENCLVLGKKYLKFGKIIDYVTSF